MVIRKDYKWMLKGVCKVCRKMPKGILFAMVMANIVFFAKSTVRFSEIFLKGSYMRLQ